MVLSLLKNFNSIKVRLELTLAVDKLEGNEYFNSIKVRLEQEEARREAEEARNFNSIKVRLEHTQVLNMTSSASFQFHKGAIRT